MGVSVGWDIHGNQKDVSHHYRQVEQLVIIAANNGQVEERKAKETRTSAFSDISLSPQQQRDTLWCTFQEQRAPQPPLHGRAQNAG